MGLTGARCEPFGGVVWAEDPPYSAFVDQEFMRELGFPEADCWRTARRTLLAPLDAHFNLTSRCPGRCDYCYNPERGAETAELSTAEAERVLEVLARQRIISVAFGGGEPLVREDLFALAERARALRLVPSLTTNGLLLDAATARRCRVFSHLHLTLNLERPAPPAGSGLVDLPEQLQHLRQAGITFGVNFVVTRRSFAELERLARRLRELRVRDLMLLRYKPAGRGAAHAAEFSLTPEQGREFYPLIRRLARRYGLAPRIDCSFLPMVCYHRPDPRTLDFFGAQGCQGGHYIIEITPDGRFRACSFVEDCAGSIQDLPELWDRAPALLRFREWPARAPEPCRSCAYLDLCRGGCHAVAERLTGNFGSPDPGCPIVQEAVGA
jgi:radical SAM protein with 4Fe4S-binding SPASM domain